jgi:hypothetical protein
VSLLVATGCDRFACEPAQERPSVAWTKIDGFATSSSPAFAEFEDRLYVLSRGLDSSIAWSTFDGTSWAPPQTMANAATSSRLNLAVYKGKLYAACTGLEGQLWWSERCARARGPRRQALLGDEGNQGRQDHLVVEL